MATDPQFEDTARIALLHGAGHAHNLPRPLTSFIGREAEIQAVLALLRGDSARLVTLTGPGGIGKTRLAIDVAARFAAERPDGARFVSLAEVRDVDLVAGEIARARIGVLPAGSGITEDIAIAAYTAFDGLLVVDNVEHVIDAVPMLARLLAASPRLTILATSRTRLRLSAEQVFDVAPLSVPEHAAGAGLAELKQGAAVRLFVERATARSNAFALTDSNAATVAAICVALGGLPLAIEVAAAHIDLLTPESLLARLRQRRPLLERGAVDTPDRHRSVRAAVGWSYELLDANGRDVFRRLSVFVGGFTLDAAAAVLGPDTDALAAVSQLVDDSLLTARAAPDGGTRYAMLEPIREFAIALLVGSVDEAWVRDRHAAFFDELAEWSDWAYFMVPAEGERRLARLDAETANIRAALSWYRECGDHHSLGRMASNLGSLWIALGHPREGQRWLDNGLRHGRDLPTGIRAKALAILSWCLNTQGEQRRALEVAEQSLAFWRTTDDPLHMAQALILCGVPAYRIDGRHGDAAHCFEEALAVLSSLDSPEWVPNARAMCVCQLGAVALIEGDTTRADSLLRSARNEEAARGYSLGESYVYGTALPLGLADVARARGDPVEAIASYRIGLAIGRRSRNLRAVCHGLGGVAGSLAALGEHRAAARCFGACEALHEQLGYDFPETLDRQRAFGLPEPWQRSGESFGDWQRHRDAFPDRMPVAPIRDPAGAASAWADGRELPLDAAIDLAMAATFPRVTRIADAPSRLTPREVDVLRLLVEGLTDSAIADALFISRRTAATHVRHIYDKLGVSTRAQAAVWAVRNEIS